MYIAYISSGTVGVVESVKRTKGIFWVRLRTNNLLSFIHITQCVRHYCYWTYEYTLFYVATNWLACIVIKRDNSSNRQVRGCWLIAHINSTTIPVAPLHRPTSVHRFIVSMACAPLARKTTGSSPEISSALVFLAHAVKCWALILAIGCCSAESFSKLYFATSSLL